MDDFKIWFYVIVAIIYVVSRVLKKGSGDKAPQGPSDDYVPAKPAGKASKESPMTFEELLKEIAESKTPTPKPKPVATPKPVIKPAYVDYDDDIKEETDTETFATYEKAKKEAFYRPSLEETSKVSDTPADYGRFNEFTIKKKGTLLKKYASELRTKSGFKRAIVLNEILNRRF